jgi:hypothetical protein
VQTNWPNNSVSITATCRIQYISAALHPLAEIRAGGLDLLAPPAARTNAAPKMLAGPAERGWVVWDNRRTLEGAESEA